MKATHVRPLLAFWVLASVAAFITSVGLRAPSTSPVETGASTPPSTSAGPSGPHSARPQQVQPSTVLTGILSPGVWSSAAAAELAARLANGGTPADLLPGGSTTVPATAVAAPGGPSGSGGSGGSGGSSEQSGGSGDTTAVARPTATTTDGPGNGHGKGRGKGHGPNAHSTTRPGDGRGH